MIIHLSYKIDDASKPMKVAIFSDNPTFRFEMPRIEEIKALSGHAAALAIAKSNVEASRMIGDTIDSGDELKIAFMLLMADDLSFFDSEERRIDVPAYKLSAGKMSVKDAEGELRNVFDSYPEYSDVQYGGGDFMAMVRRFAQNDFYKLHHLSKEYLNMLNDFENREPPFNGKDPNFKEFNAQDIFEYAKSCIVEDVQSGQVPATVPDFGDLHNFVDANEYYGVILPHEDREPERFNQCIKACNDAADMLDTWIKSGGIAEALEAEASRKSGPS